MIASDFKVADCVQFEDAVEVFDDPFSIAEQDRVEGGEYRWQTLGITISKTFNAEERPTNKERARYEHSQI